VYKCLLDHLRVFDTSDYFDSAPVFFADRNIDIEYALEALCPAHGGILLYRRPFIAFFPAMIALASL
jgi:hypothetical protein